MSTKLYFTISGGQATGKTTLCHRVVSNLKRQGLNAGYTPEAVRLSYLMFRGERSEKMHLESLLIHISQEIIASEHYDVLVSDRSALDYLAYANLRYSPESQNHFLKSVRALTREYSAIYDKIFVTPDFRGIDPGDPLRRGEDVASPDVCNEIVRLCEELSINWSWVTLNDQGTPQWKQIVDEIVKSF